MTCVGREVVVTRETWDNCYGAQTNVNEVPSM